MSSRVTMLTTCLNRRRFLRSFDCPMYPVGEAARWNAREGILTHEALSRRSERVMLRLLGMGPRAIPKLKAALDEHELSFKRT